MARPARLELATFCLEGRCSIQLSYGRVAVSDSKSGAASQNTFLDRLRSCTIQRPTNRSARSGLRSSAPCGTLHARQRYFRHRGDILKEV
jgi:hypothetical protein